MTAPDLPTWTVADDGWGDSTIWSDDNYAVASRWGERIRIDPAFTEQVWSVLTAVLAPDETTVERLARAVYEAWPDTSQPASISEPDRAIARAALAALAGTSAQARHTDGGAAGGGEDG